MKIMEIMSKNIDRVAPEMSIADAAGRMRDDDVGSLLVADDDKLLGMLTDRDIVVRVVGNGSSIENTCVRDAMTDKVLYAYDDEEATNVARNMADEQVRRMPVVNRDKMLVGVVSLGDIAGETPAVTAGETLEKITQD